MATFGLRTRLVSNLVIFCATLLIDGMASADVRAVPHPVSPIAAHVFQPPLLQWIKEVSYLKEMPDDNGYEGFTSAQRDPNFTDYLLEHRYFKNEQDQKTGKFCKILQYSPQGYLEDDIEIVDHNQYIRKLYADGSVASYIHYNLLPPRDDFVSGVVDGYSVSPVNHTIMRLTAGNGDLIFWGSDEGTFQHVWYLNGAEYLTVKYDKGTCRRMRLDNSSNPVDGHFCDIYIWTSSQETLDTQNEYWIKFPGQQPSASLMDKSLDATGTWHQLKVPGEDDPVKQRIRRANLPIIGSVFLPVPLNDPTRQALSDQLAKDYAARRAAFIKNYSFVLAKSGHTWQNLNIENVLKSQ